MIPPKLLMVTVALAACAPALPQAPTADASRPEITVGASAGDLRGEDGRALQAAVDYIAGLGGGTVHIAPGRYAMRNALRLRDSVHIIGTPGETILAAVDAAESDLAADGDCNQYAISLVDPSGFRLGDGVAVSDTANGGGFCVTTATLTERLDERTFRISTPLYLDYYASKGGKARLAFPVVAGWHVKGASIEGLTIEGNKEHTTWLDGCRGGGIYLFECADIAVRHCVVREYNGDGISFQVSARVSVEDCLAERNAGHGLHPGSGSQEPVMRRNRVISNGNDGMWVCWRVQHGVFEDNELRDNGRDGLSIGHKDSDNLFRRNSILANAKAGVRFRKEEQPQGAHRNIFEENRILDNGGSGAARAAVVVEGQHEGVVFRKNAIGNAKSGGPTRTGIVVGKDARGFVNE